MLIQTKIIQSVKEKCTEDKAIAACMMYGSFTKGEGDQYSDVEFYIFIADDKVENFSSKPWISDLYPVDLFLYNEYGTKVAIFSNMIRGEFHFLPLSEIGIIKTFKPSGVFPNTESMYIYDSTGQLKPLLDVLSGAGPDRLTDENVNFAFNNFVNAWLMGVNVLERGESARSLEVLTQVQKFLLQLLRVKEQTVERWLNSTKNLEKDLSNESYHDYVSITSSLNENELKTAYKNALKLAEKLNKTLATHYKIEVNQPLISKLNQHFT